MNIPELRAKLEATTRVAPSVTALVRSIADAIDSDDADDLGALSDLLRERAPHLANSCIAGTPTEGELPDPALDDKGAQA